MLTRKSRPASRKEKKIRVFFFFSFARVTVLLSREARLCFRESHGRASRKGKNKTCFLFFSFLRVTVLLLREARLCLRESHGRASQKGKKYAFSVFFLSRESRFCFRERHGCAFVRVTAVPLGNGKNAFSLFSGFASARGTVVIS